MPSCNTSLKPLHAALIGNPNAGKTTLFNALTKSHQRIGNWAGVTVEKKTGQFKTHQYEVELVDLPGTYSLIPAKGETALDATIAIDYLSSNEPELLIISLTLRISNVIYTSQHNYSN